MALSQHLVQKQTQKLIITQELRQSIELLPLSNLELSEKIQHEILENPLIEDSSMSQDTAEYKDENPQNSEDQDNTMESSEFRENYERGLSPSVPSDSKHQFLQNAIESPETLKDSLLSQLHLLELSSEELRAGEVLISDLNEKGFLRSKIKDLSRDVGLSEEVLIRVLEQIYLMEPAGCGAVDIQESLYIQSLYFYPEEAITHRILKDYFESLEKLDYKTIEKQTGYTFDQIQKALQIIKKLEPYPGTLFNNIKTDYIIPDVIVVERNGQYEVVINDDWMPALTVNNDYLQIMNLSSTSKDDKAYFQGKLDSANWLIKSIDQRRKTLFLVMSEIVKFQKDFFVNGPGYLKPMTLRDIAESDNVNLHDSTVSRITSNKFVQTKWGIFELKYFFTSSLSSRDGEERHSAKNIQEKIKKLVDEETLDNILSDQDIADRIAAEGIQIARRTVAKYRNGMNILPVERRKKIKEFNQK